MDKDKLVDEAWAEVEQARMNVEYAKLAFHRARSRFTELCGPTTAALRSHAQPK